MKTWLEFYNSRMGEQYKRYAKKRYWPFILKIIQASGYFTKLVVEAGCGIATISSILNTLDLRCNQAVVEAYDLCPDMVALAQQNIDGLTRVQIGDILRHTPPKAVVFSHGVIEHFSDEMIEQTMIHLCHNSFEHLHYVPGEKYRTPSFGDERLLSISKWYSILPQVLNWKVKITSFNSGYDYIIHYKKG